jgi:hypothetical protein
MSVPSLFLHSLACSWTASGGSAVALKRVTQTALTFNADVINNRADGDIYDSSAHIVGWKPTVTLAGLNVGLYAQLVSGLGAFTWTWGNADTPGGAGSIVWALLPCMNPLGDSSNPYAQYATGNLSFMGLAADGATNPLSYTITSSGSFLGTRPAPPLIASASRTNRLGLPFLPPASKDAPPAEGTPVDAVFMPGNAFARGPNHFRNRCAAQVEAAKILKVDPDEVNCRLQGTARIYTASPHFTLYHTKESDFSGHRFGWRDRGDGISLGYLTDDARAADEDAAADAD